MLRNNINTKLKNIDYFEFYILLLYRYKFIIYFNLIDLLYLYFWILVANGAKVTERLICQ